MVAKKGEDGFVWVESSLPVSRIFVTSFSWSSVFGLLAPWIGFLTLMGAAWKKETI